jgi:hypothetical protein
MTEGRSAAENTSEAIGQMPRGLKDAVGNLRDMVEMSDDIHDVFKEMPSTWRKLSQQLSKTKDIDHWRDALLKAKEHQEKALEFTKKNTAEYRLASKAVSVIDRQLSAIQGKTGQIGKELQTEVVDAMEQFHKEAEKTSRVLKHISVGHITRGIYGMKNAFVQAGLAKSGRLEKHMGAKEKAADIRKASQMRREANRQDFALRVGSAQARTGDLGRQAAMLGLRGGAAKTFRAYHEASASGTMTPQLEKAYSRLAEHGTGIGGVLSKAAGGMELGLGGAMDLVGKFAPIVAFFELLKDGFDMFAKQNRELEGAMAKGGLFANMNPQDLGLDNARNNLKVLNPLHPYGLTLERNMKIAGAMANTYDVADIRDRGIRNTAGDQFGPGAFGEFQKIAAGSGRLMGFTDEQSVEMATKLADQYSMTLETTNKFFVETTKDAKAAGLGVTKYLSLIEQVSSQFSHMNKNLMETAAILRQLSKYGVLGTEDMEDFFKAFQSNQPTNFGNAATKMFIAGQMSPERMKAIQEAQENAAVGMSAGLNDALNKAGVKGIIDVSKMVKKSPEEQQRIIDEAMDELEHSNATGAQKKPAFDQLEALSRNLHIANAARQGPQAYAAALGILGQNPLTTLAESVTQMQTATGKGGLFRFLNAPETLGKSQSLRIQGLAELMGKSTDQLYTGGRVLARQAGTSRVDEAIADKSGKLAMKVVEGLQAEGYGGLAGKKFTPATALKYIQDNQKSLAIPVGSLDDTINDFIKKGGGVQAASAEDEAKALASAHKLALGTRTSGEIISDAFASWFTEIIHLLTQIVDYISSDSKEQKATAASIFGNEGNRALAQNKSAAISQQISDIDDKLNTEAVQQNQAQYDQLTEQKKQLQHNMALLNQTSGTYAESMEFQRLVRGAGPLSTSKNGTQVPEAAWDFMDMSKATGSRIYDILANDPGVGVDPNRKTLMLSPERYAHWQSRLNDAAKQGLITDTAQANGSHVINITNYSVEYPTAPVDPNHVSPTSAGESKPGGAASKTAK